MGRNTAEDDETEGIAHEKDELALLEEVWILAEDGAILRPLYVAFEGDQSLFAADLEDLVQELEDVEIRAAAHRRAFQGTQDFADDLYERLWGRRNDEGPQRRAADDNELRDLHEDEEGAALESKPA